MAESSKQAPGAPGLPPTWTSSAKDGVGTALARDSTVWFTLRQGILTEVYYPFVDRACTRDLGLVVTDRTDFFSEEKHDTASRLTMLGPGVPAYHLVNTCTRGRYRIEKTVLTDPGRPVVLQETRFVPLEGGPDDYSLFVLLAPHLDNHGGGNSAWLGDYKGIPMLFAQRGDTALALACSVPWRRRSAGFVGISDGWQDLSRHRRMTWDYDRADDGNVALTGEVDLHATGGEFLLALAFGSGPAEAALQARAALLNGFESARKAYVRAWTDWQQTLFTPGRSAPHPHDLHRVSAMAIRCHEAKHFPGGIIASLSIPWGFARGDDRAAGYHLVWPRDLVETAGALLAVRAHDDARRVLFYLRLTQDGDGHWPQNMWLNGTPHWKAQQMDETGLVILLADLLRREQALTGDQLAELWPMLRQAARYLVVNGPVSGEDRWEEDAGYSAFTLAVEVAALLVAADLAEAHGEPDLAPYLRETADAWNAAIDRWLYATGTGLARGLGVDGYYVRMAPPREPTRDEPAAGMLPIPNHPGGRDPVPANEVVSPDALALVRFGLRGADDPRILNTVRVLDATLKVDTPGGPAWHRYTDDGYGEHADGAPFDGSGIGRAWPLLAGERAHLELAAGRRDEAERLLRTMENFAGPGGLLPEQVWDTADIPARGLHLGKPSGSAMPLVWAHAEYLKLRRSLHDGHVFDRPPQTYQRYVEGRTTSPHVVWRFNQKCRSLPAGKVLRVEVRAPAVVRWSSDGWHTGHDMPTRDSGWGVHLADLPTDHLPAGAAVDFTFHWTATDRWEGKNFRVVVAAAPSPAVHDGHATGRPRSSERKRRGAARK